MKKVLFILLFIPLVSFMVTETMKADELAVSKDGSLSDTNIRYIGRWDKTNVNQYQSYWTGAYIRVGFTGKSISIRLAKGTTLAVSIDGETPRSVKANSGLTTLNLETLSETQHSLLVAGAGQNEELSFLGLLLEDGEETFVLTDRPLIEFIGDSNTAGTGPEGTSAVNYAWNTAEALNCDHTQIAFSGISLSSGYGCLPVKIGMDSLYFNMKNYNHLAETPAVPWSFEYTPDIVVVNLGTNDECGKASEATVKRHMSSFLEKLRERLPTTHLAVMRPYSGIYAGPLSTAVKQMNDQGDTKIHYIDTEGWLSSDDLSDGIHTNAQGGAKVVSRLSPILQNILNKISSVEQESFNYEIVVSPNPVKDHLTVNSLGEKIRSISLINMAGEEIVLNSVRDQSNQFNLQHLISGIYTLVVSLDNNRILAQKIIKI